MKKNSLATKIVCGLVTIFYLTQSRTLYMFCTHDTDYLKINEYTNRMLKFEYINNFTLMNGLFALIGLVFGFISIFLMLRKNENTKKFALASAISFLLMLIYYGFFDTRWIIFNTDVMLGDNFLFGVSLLYYFYSIAESYKIKRKRIGY